MAQRAGAHWLRRLSLVLGLAAFALLLALAFSEGPVVAALTEHGDKPAHIAGFAVLGLLFALGGGARAFAVAAMGLALAAGAVELAQPMLTRSREASWGDVWAGWLGLAGGLAAVSLLNAIAWVWRSLGQENAGGGE